MDINLKDYEKDYYGFVYETTNLKNGKKYIGQKKFTRGYENYLGSGKYLKPDIKKYGKENFKRDILAIANTQELLNELEKHFITVNDAVKSDNYYNDINHGQCGNVFANKTEEEMKEISKKMSKSLKGKFSGANHPMFGHSCTEFMTEEKIQQWKENISRTSSSENNGMYGKKHTDEAKEKMSKSLKGKFSGANHPRARAIVQLDKDNNFIKEWTCIQDAINNVPKTSKISECCSGYRNTSGGYKWMYKEDYEKMISDTD